MNRGLVGPILGLGILVAACGGGGSAPRAGGGANPTPSGAVASAAGRASLQLSGTVAGPLTLQGMSCQPAGSANVLVSISGTVGEGQYTVGVGAPQSGTFQLASAGPAAVEVTETRPGFRKWTAGAQQPAGSGSLTIEPRAGQVDAELSGIQGAPGSVRVQGNWACP